MKLYSNDSRLRIMEAALDEFAARGYLGARVERIARAARANKQLIYYYFGSKRNLYRQVVDQVYREIAAAEYGVPASLEEDLLYWMDFHQRHPRFIQLIEWEEPGPRRRSAPDRRGIWQASLGRMRRNQKQGSWPRGLARDQFLIACIAVAAWPLVFPHVSRQITGLEPNDPRFVRARRQFVRKFARLLSRQSPKPAKR
jgi:AcrR family transcriptional regulator